VVRFFLIAEVPDPGDEWLVAFLAGPGNALVLEPGQHTVCTVFHNIILDRAIVGAPLGTGFDIDVRHLFLLEIMTAKQRRGRAAVPRGDDSLISAERSPLVAAVTRYRHFHCAVNIPVSANIARDRIELLGLHLTQDGRQHLDQLGVGHQGLLKHAQNIGGSMSWLRLARSSRGRLLASPALWKSDHLGLVCFDTYDVWMFWHAKE
jgi:hypothetical protein